MNLNQITIGATNVSESVLFYKTLGLTLIVDALPRYVRFECLKGESTFSIHKVDEILPSAISIYFEVDDLEKTVIDLKSKHIKFDTEILDQPWLWREIYLKDPSGNQIIIYHAGENRKNPPWRIEELES